MWKSTDGQELPGLRMQQVGGQYANVSCWRQHETAWDSIYKRDVSMIQSQLFFWVTITLYTVHFQI